MKIQCDLCGRDEASVFCCTDEAALCASCDHRTHRANKLASRHRRLPLISPSSSNAGQAHPLCDVCQEKRGYVFCQQDRAVLCRDCDAPIHAANHLTARHARFLLTGVRLSASPVPSSSPLPEEVVDNIGAESIDIEHGRSSDRDEVAVAEDEVVGSRTSTIAATTTSSISDYLLRTLPGWCVDDFLLDDGTWAANVCSQAGEQVGVEFPLWFQQAAPGLAPATFNSGTFTSHNYYNAM